MVEYFSVQAMPGHAFFKCDALRASLTTNSCAKNWGQANHEGSEARMTCRRCPIGAFHAGEVDANMSPLKGTLTCGRCHRGSERLIGGHVCVSCKNREYEVLRGYNAKGSKPVNLPPLVPRRQRYLEADEVKVATRARTIDGEEMLIAILRDAAKRVRFAFTPPTPRLAQAALF